MGENTGRLDEAFKQIAGYMEMERETKNGIKTATRYPMFVLGAISIAIVILNIFVIPAFAMISKAGVPITQGLHVISRAIGNEYMAKQVSTMRHGIERGSGIAQTARESGMFTPVVLQMMEVGEETGSIDELMEQAAGFYEEEVDYELKGLTDAVEPILIIAIGMMVLVLVLALGVFLPLWDFASVANK